MYKQKLYTCHDTVITSISFFELTFAVTIMGVGSIKCTIFLMQHKYVNTYMSKIYKITNFNYLN